MHPIVRFLLGLEKEEIPAEGASHWELSSMPEGTWLWLAVLVIGLSVALIIAVYRGEKVLSTPRRVTLVVLRIAALALITLVLLNPKMITEVQVELPGKTLVLLDASASMDQRDSYEDSDLLEIQSLANVDRGSVPSRGEIALAALNSFDVVSRLEENNRVHLYKFGDGLTELPSLGAVAAESFRAEETRLGGALAELFDRHAADSVSSVVLLSDGRDNHTVHPLDIIRDRLTRKRVPIHAIGIGKSDDLKNFSVRSLTTPRLAEVGFPIQIEAVVHLVGIRGQVKASLYRDRELLEQRNLTSMGGDEFVELKFIDTIREKGTYRYSLRIPPHPTEESTVDNRQEAVIVATDHECRLLLVSGNGTPEYKKLRNFFLRDNSILVSCLLMNADREMPQDGNVVIDRLPNSDDDLEDYDAVVLLDPDPDLISDEFTQSLTRFVSEDGGGLIFIAGDIHTHRLTSTPRVSDILDLLPTHLGGTSRSTNQIYDQAWHPRLTPSGNDHPLCRLANNVKKNQELWQTLPPFYYSYAATRLKPAALSLVENSRGHIIFALQRAGRGESIYLGSDNFNEWGTVGRRFPERFWGGLVRYLAEARRQSGVRRVHLGTDRERYRERDRVEIYAQVSDTSATHLPSPFLEVVIESLEAESRSPASPEVKFSADGERISRQPSMIRLHPVSGDPGRYRGFFRPGEGGEYALRLEEEETIISVRASSSERDDPTPDFAILEELAEASGGSFLSWHRVEALPDEIASASQKKIVGRRVATLWDSAALMLLFCLLLILEWILRKLWQLN